MKKNLVPPIILIGNYRSGTTVAQNIIGLNSSTVAWYEPRTLWLYADPSRPHDVFDERDATEKVVRYIRRRFLRYQIQNGNRRIIEKTPANILKVPYVHAIFPDATYLYMTRNPLSCISSMELKWQKTKKFRGILRSVEFTPITQLPYYIQHFGVDFVRKRLLRKKYISRYGPRYQDIQLDIDNFDILTVIARQWAICNRKAREDLEKLESDRVLSFRYEDLMENTEDCCRQIYQHCGLSYSEEMLRCAKQMVDPGRQLKWLRLDSRKLQAIMPEIREEMKICGYEVPAFRTTCSGGRFAALPEATSKK